MSSQKKKVPEIVITGGPCSGKSTGMGYISEKLQDRGFRVFIVPEIATEFILGGIGDISALEKNDPQKYFEVERQMILATLSRREEKRALARIFNDDKCVILFDRGIMDVRAYMPNELFDAVLQEEGLTLHDVRDSFDGVIHLITAANGAEKFYTKENNQARRENAQEAREADEKTLAVWVGHPHLKIIDNSTGFESKMKRTFQAIARMLGIPVPIEIERKYLLRKKPNFRRKELMGAQKVYIEQMYLASPNGRQVRIRRRSQNGSATYYLAEKIDISGIKRNETEDFISASEFIKLSKNQDPATDTIRKYRYCFVYNNQYFELDIFLEPRRLRGRCLLEIELTEENDKVDLPPFLDIEREVTDEPEFKNYEQSKKPTV